MSNKLYSIEVQGNHSRWSFPIWAEEEYAEDWRRDGLDVSEIVNTIPEAINDLQLTRLWCWLQDIGVIRRG